MFNWFRRNEKAKQQPTDTQPETKPEVTTESKSSESTTEAEPDYLAFAKAAYKNIQERKGEATKKEDSAPAAGVETSESTEVADIVEEINESEAVAESTEVELTEPAQATTESTTIDTESEVAAQTPQPSPEKPASNVPAWMQKSKGLDKLKETAIETPEPEVETEPELDEDFIWSSQEIGRASCRER